MKNKLHIILGLCSHVLLYTAAIIGFLIILKTSLSSALLYIMIAIAWLLITMYCQCRKCCCQLNCTHTYLGLITKKLFGKEEGPYNKKEKFLVFGSVSLLMLFPIPWLLGEFLNLLVYGILLLISFIIIAPIFCTKCDNKYCGMNRVSRGV